MTIEVLEKRIQAELLHLISEETAPCSAGLLKPLGYKLRLQASIVAGGKVRKKRASASSDSFDPRTDGILITFEPELEPEESTQPIREQGRPVTPANRQPVGQPSASTASDPLRIVVLSLDRAEAAQHQFVGLKYFRDKLLPQEREAWISDDSMRRRVLKEMIDLSIIETGKVPNPQSVDFPVTSIHLNRQHPIVEEILSETPNRQPAEFRPVRQRGELASRTIVKDRR